MAAQPITASQWALGRDGSYCHLYVKVVVRTFIPLKRPDTMLRTFILFRSATSGLPGQSQAANEASTGVVVFDSSKLSSPLSFSPVLIQNFHFVRSATSGLPDQSRAANGATRRRRKWLPLGGIAPLSCCWHAASRRQLSTSGAAGVFLQSCCSSGRSSQGWMRCTS